MALIPDESDDNGEPPGTNGSPCILTLRTGPQNLNDPVDTCLNFPNHSQVANTLSPSLVEPSRPSPPSPHLPLSPPQRCHLHLPLQSHVVPEFVVFTALRSPVYYDMSPVSCTSAHPVGFLQQSDDSAVTADLLALLCPCKRGKPNAC